jgi:UDP-N-acetyl-D-mannosaminuronate dehydrogenase
MKLKGYQVFAFDPKVKKDLLSEFNFHISDSVDQAIENAKILIIMNKSTEFKKISIKILNKKLLNKNILDPFGVLKNLNLKNKGFNYHVIGN